MRTETADASHEQQVREHVAIYGHFGTTNFGNESTLLALLDHLRDLLPDARFTCICTHPKEVEIAHRIAAVPIAPILGHSWVPRHRWTRTLRRLLIGIPSEPYRWVKGFVALRGADLLIVPGTNLLTDIDGLLGYGPYNLFRWSVTARLRRCRLVFLSVGAGPLHGMLGRLFVRGALSMAQSRFYRDESTKSYLEEIGFRTRGDPVIPDLAFSLPEERLPQNDRDDGRAPTVGLGLMADPWKYGADRPPDAVQRAYLESLVGLADWFLGRGYCVRLLIGDRWDMSAVTDFRRLLDEAIPHTDPSRIVERPIFSVDDLMSETAATDIVVATRFHNVLFALLCEKPAMAISFHHKCESLMKAMGLSDYCVDLAELDRDLLVGKARKLEANAAELRPLIRQRTLLYRQELDRIYGRLCSRPAPPARSPAATIAHEG